MRACARVALASIAVSASISLSGCAAIEELKETFLRWVESQKLPSGRGVSAGELPEATPVVPPEKTPKEPSKRHAQPKDAARKPQRQTVVLPPKKPPIPDSTEAVVLPPKKPPIPDSTEAVRPEGTEGNPRRPTPRWLPSRWPEAPPPGRFSR
jgi:type IV secretory pathway VirB10-like protein